MSRSNLAPEIAEKIIKDAIGNEKAATTIFEILTWVFGRKRAKEALKDPDNDPEFVTFSLLIDAKVNSEWKRLGIDRNLGPYVQKSK